LKSIGCIDEPTDGEKVGRFFRLKGWAIYQTSEIINLFIDNTKLGKINPFIHREDVTRAHPNIEKTKPTGFDQLFEIPELPAGLHTLYLKSEDNPLLEIRR
jgi:hypothetical protein